MILGIMAAAASSEAAGAMTPIATATTSSTTTSVAFTSIPATYDDLMIVAYLKSPSGGRLGFRFNSDSGTNYSYLQLRGNGTSASGSNSTGIVYGQTGFVSDLQFSANTLHILNYKNTSYNKTSLGRGAGDQNGVVGADYGSTILTASLWRSTAAINRIDVYCAAGNSSQSISTGAVIALYGITKAA